MIIGLSGRAGSGKDTVGGFIQELAKPLSVRCEGFADRLKVSAARALGFDGTKEECVDFCNLVKQENIGITVAAPGRCLRAISGREYLQRYGTESHREVFGSNFWVDALLPEGVDISGLLVITDVRFPNEAERIRELGGTIWYIERSTQIASHAHASEQPLPSELIDFKIRNYGSLDDLRDEVRIAWQQTNKETR